MKKIVVDFPPEAAALARLNAVSTIELVFVDRISEEARLLPASLIKNAHALFCSSPPANLDEMKALEWIQLCSSGFDHVLSLRLPERNIQVTNARGVFDAPIAEWCIAMMINLLRDVPQMLRNQANSVWDRAARFQAELRGRTLGIWGYGGLGRETARLAKALGMKVLALAPNGIRNRSDSFTIPGTGDPEGKLPDALFSLADKKKFLANLDFLVLACPLNPRTQGMIGADELQAMRPTAFLLNPARGPLVQEQALVAALQKGRIAGAALDTHFHYPLPPEHPLWKMSNVILTPHISGSSLSTHYRPRMWELFTQNVERFVNGQPLLNQISPEQLMT